jgi:hypothetical protein
MRLNVWLQMKFNFIFVPKEKTKKMLCPLLNFKFSSQFH